MEMNRSACETSYAKVRDALENEWGTYVVVGNVGEVVGSDELPHGLDKVFYGG